MRVFKYIVLILLLFLFVACKEEKRESINLYVDKDLIFILEDISKFYEKKNNVKINISTEIKHNLRSFDILVTNNENIFEKVLASNENDKNSKKKNEEKINLENEYERKILLEDEILIIGRRKLGYLENLLHSSIAVSGYDSTIGKSAIDYLSQENFFNEVSKKIEYKEDSISALQSVDLYEMDYAIIGKTLLSKIKNSNIVYYFPESIKIGYNVYIRKNSKNFQKDFYSFFSEEEVKKIIAKHKEIN